jgi:hypothetical protein
MCVGACVCMYTYMHLRTSSIRELVKGVAAEMLRALQVSIYVYTAEMLRALQVSIHVYTYIHMRMYIGELVKAVAADFARSASIRVYVYVSMWLQMPNMHAYM